MSTNINTKAITQKVTKENIGQTLQGEIVLLDFWASWCGPCRMFGPIFEAAAQRYPDVVFGKVDTEAEQELASSFQIRSIPMLMAFRQGVLLFAQPGALPAEALDELIGKIKALDMVKVKEQIAAAQKAEEHSAFEKKVMSP